MQQTPSNALSHAAELRATALIYSASFSYMVVLGATQILVPLYGLHLGFDIAELGVIACCVGLIFTVPLGLAIHVAGYEHLFGERGESANVASPNPPAPPQI